MTIYNVMGWGKGKTTSAIGISARALMNGEKVVFFQFLKDGKDKGVDALYEISKDIKFAHFAQGTKGFDLEGCSPFWDFCLESIEMTKPDLIIFDELNVALDYNLFTETVDEMISQIQELAETYDIYITGRINNHELRHKMIDIADIATNCYCEAHIYNRTCKKCGMDFNPHYEYCPICGSKLKRSKKAEVGREC